MDPFQLQDVQKAPFQVTAMDADNNPTTLPDGASVEVSSSDSASATVSTDATPASGTIASGTVFGASKTGAVQINVAVKDASGNVIATGTQDVLIVAGPLATIGVSLGAAVGQ